MKPVRMGFCVSWTGGLICLNVNKIRQAGEEAMNFWGELAFDVHWRLTISNAFKVLGIKSLQQDEFFLWNFGYTHSTSRQFIWIEDESKQIEETRSNVIAHHFIIVCCINSRKIADEKQNEMEFLCCDIIMLCDRQWTMMMGWCNERIFWCYSV